MLASSICPDPPTLTKLCQFISKCHASDDQPACFHLDLSWVREKGIIHSTTFPRSHPSTSPSSLSVHRSNSLRRSAQFSSQGRHREAARCCGSVLQSCSPSNDHIVLASRERERVNADSALCWPLTCCFRGSSAIDWGDRENIQHNSPVFQQREERERKQHVQFPALHREWHEYIRKYLEERETCKKE